MAQDLTRQYLEGNTDVASALARLRKDIYNRRKDLDVLCRLEALFEQSVRASVEKLLSPLAVETVRKVVAENGDTLRASDQATMWAGHTIGLIIGVSTNEPNGKALVKRAMRMMVEQGVLKIESVYDARQGRDTPRIVVASGSDQ